MPATWDVVSDRQLHAEALALACHLNHPVYDCLDLALARREAATLITADRRLRQLGQGSWRSCPELVQVLP